MALQNKKKEYIKAIGIEGWNINHKTIHVRYYLWGKKSGRTSKEFEPDRNQCVTDVPIPETFEPVGTDTVDIMKQLMYAAMKGYKTKGTPINHPAETDKNDVVIKKAWTEETFDYPYADMVDC